MCLHFQQHVLENSTNGSPRENIQEKENFIKYVILSHIEKRKNINKFHFVIGQEQKEKFITEIVMKQTTNYDEVEKINQSVGSTHLCFSSMFLYLKPGRK